jgi:1-acyl-sn-glycerol-3-phosphate acyltransferase
VNLPRPVRLEGSAWAKRILRWMGWRLVFDGLPTRQGVLIVYPHTSNWDFIYGILAKWGMGIDVTFWGKDALFRVPLFGRWLRWLGGLPVDRSRANGVVGQMSAELAAAREQDRFLWLALSPEGTRRHSSAWRSGFYHVALAAKVPVGLAFIDYAQREVGAEHFMMLSGQPEADMVLIRQHLQHRQGKRPALAAPIRLKP